MSLDSSEQKNMPIVKDWSFTPIQGFADGSSFGVSDSGDLVHIADTSTWAGVFKNGLSLHSTSSSLLPKQNLWS